jgi:hypothetical protein
VHTYLMEMNKGGDGGYEQRRHKYDVCHQVNNWFRFFCTEEEKKNGNETSGQHNHAGKQTSMRLG